MFSLTPAQGGMLTAAWLALTTALLLGVFRFLPRSRRQVPAYVTCPMLGRPIGAHLMRDEWTRSFCEVVRCDALGGYAATTCNQRCLKTGRIAPLMRP
jgi:hypothetical protein